MQPALTLYHYWRSSCSWRVRWALALKGLPYESVAVNLLKSEQRSDEYLALNPTGQVPMLKVGDRTVSESMAIIEWLEETYPYEPLLPKDPWDKALVREVTMMVVAGMQPLQNLKVTRFYSEDQKQRDSWSQHFIEEGFHALEKKLAPYSGPYAFGHQLTLADIAIVPQVYNALRVHVEMRRFPRMEAIYSNCLKTDYCDKAAPHRQPDAQP
ncbi:MAG TPA: maleylacetoacetate isomerase [Oligoflexus sp.]|uniref:maleylacetoacetate isomerase n=1 Tax=Oligoflexus sp. TaxID=1971216 RepID=UPI002D5341E4|nr:maleylacetoacetate isomerase [Oligoflexus sp.]HYX37415.1 maleylacetoacetate isomerase [Oligoflexus sp.]